MDSDIIAVFPLPNLIFFPNTDLPLHIFEPRYCQMINDTIQNKQMIGMFLLRPGWQDDYYGNPPIYPVGCAGELIHVENLPDGKFNISLHGLTRVRAMETVQETPYRRVRVQILEESSHADLIDLNRTKDSLLESLHDLGKFLNDPIPPIADPSDLLHVVHTIATMLPLDPEQKRALLELDDSLQRAVAVQEHLARLLNVLKLTSRFGHLRPTDPNAN